MPEPMPEDYAQIKYQVDTTHENFIVVEPPQIPDDNPFDPFGQLSHIIHRDWREFCAEGRQPSALIVDTFSEFAEDVGRHVAMAGKGNAGVGERYGLNPEDPWDPDSIRLTHQHDYGKSQEQAIQMLRLLMRSRAFPHVVLLGHRKAITETKMMRQPNGKFKEQTEVVGYDMDVPGRKWLGNMTKFTEQYLWMTDDGIGEMDIRLHLRSDGKHKTKLRTPMQVESEMEVPFSYEGMCGVIRQVAEYAGVDMASADHGLRSVVYGEGGTGKTMLWTSLPPETFEVGPAVYVPYDPSAARLRSVWPELRSTKENDDE